MAQNTQLIQDIDNDGMPQPLKVLNVYKEETSWSSEQGAWVKTSVYDEAATIAAKEAAYARTWEANCWKPGK